MLLLRLILCSSAVAYMQSHKHPDESVDFALSIPNIDIGELDLEGSLPDPVRQALDMIKNVESLPACAKVATSALLHSCSALDGSLSNGELGLAEGMDLLVEEEVDVYAARLAICELKGANVAVPYDCRSFVPTDRSTRKRGFRGFWSRDGPTKPQPMYQHYDEITQDNLKQCRNALSSTPQTWTSYSNNRQNAAVLCRGMRSEIEKDQQIHLARILAGVSAGAAESLHDAAQRYEQIRISFQEIVASIPAFHQALATNKEQLAAAQRLWDDLGARYDRALGLAEELARLLEKSKIGIQDIDSHSSNATQKLERLVATMDDTIVRQGRDIDTVSAETAAIVHKLHAYQDTVQETLGREVAIAGGQVVSYTASLTELGKQVEALIMYIDRQNAERDASLGSFFERQSIMYERLDERWSQVQNMTDAIHETLSQALPMVQKVTSVGRVLAAWMESAQSQLLGFSAAAIRGAALVCSAFVALTRLRTILRYNIVVYTVAALTIAVTLFVVGQSLIAAASTVFTSPTIASPVIVLDAWRTHGFGGSFSSRYCSSHFMRIMVIPAIGVCVAGVSYTLYRRLQAIRASRWASTESHNSVTAPRDEWSRLPINDPKHMAGRIGRAWTAPRSIHQSWDI